MGNSSGIAVSKDMYMLDQLQQHYDNSEHVITKAFVKCVDPPTEENISKAAAAAAATATTTTTSHKNTRSASAAAGAPSAGMEGFSLTASERACIAEYARLYGVYTRTAAGQFHKGVEQFQRDMHVLMTSHQQHMMQRK